VGYAPRVSEDICIGKHPIRFHPLIDIVRFKERFGLLMGDLP
jgi:hypothetical protein